MSRDKLLRRLAKQHARRHTPLWRSTARAVQPVMQRIRSDVIKRAGAADSVSDLRRSFDPNRYVSEFRRRATPALARGAWAGVEVETLWIEENEPDEDEQSIAGWIAQDSSDPPPSIKVDVSPGIRRAVKAYLRTRAGGIWSQVGGSMRSRIRNVIARGLERGDDLKKMTKAVQEAARGMTSSRAKRIAWTETTSAMNNAQQIVRADYGIESKQWVSTIDKHTRTGKFDHLKPNGQIRGNRLPFDVSGQRLMYPGDWSLGASARNIVSCRCLAISYFAPRRRQSLRTRVAQTDRSLVTC